MRKYAATATLLLTLVSAGACRQKATTQASSNPSATPTAQSSMTPEQLGEIGAKIKKNPSKMDKILASYGLDEKTFESDIRKTTQSPDASKRYAAAYKTASK